MFMNERAGLPQGTELIMEDGKKLVLKEIVGKGASCIVYNAERIDHSGKAHNARVKECFPAYSAITRQGNCLIADPSVEEKFREAKARFREAYNKNVDFRNRSGLTNFTSDPYECYEQNGTVYSVFSFDEGDNYRVHEDGNLQEVFEHAKAIADVIKRYHEAGCLHLDIKPENVLITKPDKRVILFDFDSLVELEVLEKLRNGNGENNATPVLSYSDGFSAPEQMMGDLKTIGVVSDVYSVGALVWFKIFGRTPERMGYSFGTKFNFSDIKYPDERYRTGLWKELSRLFQNCLATYPPDRWNDMGEVSKCLEKLIALADVERTYLHCKYRYNSGEMHFVGRRKELKMLEDAMAVPDRNMVFVSGIGGIGKTELVRYYAHLNEENYDNIAFLHYEHSLEETLCSDNLRINAFEREEGESIEAYFERKLKVLKAVATKKDLIIIDNFDTCEEDEINKCLSLAKGCECKFLITTREDFTQGGRSLVFQIPIDRMEDDAELMELFVSYQPMEYSEDETEAIRELFELVDRHTMTVGMLANYIEYKEVLPSTLLCKLKEKSGIVNVKGSVSQEKDQEIRTRSVINHLLDLFDLYEFSPVEEEVIKSLALLGYIRITRKRFFELLSENGKDTDEEVEEAVENLRRRGWLQVDKETRKLSLHAVILDLVIGRMKPTSTECPRIVNSMIAYMERELPNETERDIRDRLMKSFMEGIVGDDLSYVRLCILYKRYDCLPIAADICDQNMDSNRETLDLAQKLYRVCLVLLDDVPLTVDDEAAFIREIVTGAIEIAREAEKLAVEYTTEASYLGRFYVELGKELEHVLDFDRGLLQRNESVNEVLDIGYQYIETVYDKGEFYVKVSDLSCDDKGVLIRMIQDFYLPYGYEWENYSAKYANCQKVFYYQGYLEELGVASPESCEVEYMTEGGVEVYLFKEKFDGLINGIEINRTEDVDMVIETARTLLAKGNLMVAEVNLGLLLEYLIKHQMIDERIRTYDMLVEVLCAEKREGEAKRYAKELVLLCRKGLWSKEKKVHIQGMLIGLYYLYKLEKDSGKKERLWKKCKCYYRKYGKDVQVIGELLPFFTEYLLDIEDKKEQVELGSFLLDCLEFKLDTEKKNKFWECLMKDDLSDKVKKELYVRVLIAYFEQEENRGGVYDGTEEMVQCVENLCERFEPQDAYCKNLIYRELIKYYTDMRRFDAMRLIREKCDFYLLAEVGGKNKPLEIQFNLWEEAASEYGWTWNYEMREKCLRAWLKMIEALLDERDIAYEYLRCINLLFECYIRQEKYEILRKEAEACCNTIFKCILNEVNMDTTWEDGFLASKIFEIGDCLKEAVAHEEAVKYYLISGICYLTKEMERKRIHEVLSLWGGDIVVLIETFCQMVRDVKTKAEKVDGIVDFYNSIKDLLSEDPRYADLQKEFTRFLDKHQRAAVEFRRE